MNRNPLCFIFASAVLALVVFSLVAQETQKGGKNKKKADEESEAPKVRPLPDDKRLLAIHLEFVKKAEKLALEYEGDKDWSKARAVYEEILALVPQYPSARQRLDAILEREASAKTVVFNVKANEGWQDTGVDLIANKPVVITATGTWVFTLEAETNAEGITIPEELRDFNPGCLIGMIPESEPGKAKPFTIGPQKQFIAEKSGRLLLRMYDTDPRDNSGALKVEIKGTFQEAKD